MAVATLRAIAPAAAQLADRTRHQIAVRLLPFLFILYIVNFLDRTNVAFAALGMSRELGVAHSKENLLGKDVQVIHALSASPAEIQMLAKAGSTISVSPGTELRIGYGFTKVSQFLDAGILVGVSVDNTVLAGDANIFSILKLVREIENARSHDEFKMSARRALELGTIEGARSLGIDDRVGSLKPGKRADLIMVSTQQTNMGRFYRSVAHAGRVYSSGKR